jgi:hypothetical protein
LEILFGPALSDIPQRYALFGGCLCKLACLPAKNSFVMLWSIGGMILTVETEIILKNLSKFHHLKLPPHYKLSTLLVIYGRFGIRGNLE